MKSYPLNWSTHHKSDSGDLIDQQQQRFCCYSQMAFHYLGRGLLVLALIASLISLTLLGMTQSPDMLAAFSWVIGFLFLALAVDNERPLVAWLQAISGLSLLALGWMASRVMPEFAVMAASIVSLWLGTLAFARRELQTA